MGNCELMVKEIAAAIPGSPKLSMVRLAEKDIRPCKACYRCLTGDCPHQDDFRGVFQAILDADAVIVAAPAYLRGTHSSIQRFADRGLQAYRHVDALYGKPAVAVATAGVEDGEGSALLGIEQFIRQLGLSLKGRAVVHATFPGDAILSEKGRGVARRLAAALDSPDDYVPAGVSCPVCKGTYFEFRGADGVYCLSCGGTGMLSVEGGNIRPVIGPPAHSWRTREEMESHGRWLIGRREEFLRQRDRLKEAVKPYLGGEFI
jgi:multimeric flavodoxin WrbA